MTNPLPLNLAYIYLMVLILVSVLCFERFKLTLKQKLISLLIFSSCSILIFKVALEWSEKDSD
ncbi:MAG: hypothetical protein LBR15_08850 [Methanobrevibacter sp.]|nr:hypothetical protein [Candidatus Methanovirga australis]